VHPAAWDPTERVRLLDHFGIEAQVLYPNSMGIGGQNLANSIGDPNLLRLCVELYNDAMAEVQEESGNRLIPMPIMPARDIAECVREAQRCAEMDYRGVNMTADPQDSGAPDLGDPAWDPFWEVCAGLGLPVHFHIGASQTALTYFGTTFWPSQDDYVKPAIGGASLFQNNSRMLLNSAYSGMFDRHPDLKMVSVESGIGWVPFMLEAMDYELEENAPEWRNSRRSTSGTTGTPPSGSRPGGETCSISSTPSGRTTSCSRRTSRTPPASTRARSRPSDRRSRRSGPRRSAR